MKSSAQPFLLAAWLVLCPLRAYADAGVGVPPVVVQAARAYAATMAGVIVNERHIDVTIAVGPIRYTQHNDAGITMNDGKFVHVRYLAITENGRALSSDALRKRSEQNDAQLARGTGFFKEPYDSRYFKDYRYESPAACACAGGTVRIRFQSLVRDDSHGDGTLEIDPRDGRVMQVRYVPSVLPPHAQTASTIEYYGQPISGLWTIVRIERNYGGRVGFFSGSGRVVEMLDHFNRCADMAQALNWFAAPQRS